MEIEIKNYPQLNSITWSYSGGNGFIDEKSAFNLYESNWRFVDIPSITECEKKLINDLSSKFKGYIHVY